MSNRVRVPNTNPSSASIVVGSLPEGNEVAIGCDVSGSNGSATPRPCVEVPQEATVSSVEVRVPSEPIMGDEPSMGAAAVSGRQVVSFTTDYSYSYNYYTPPGGSSGDLIGGGSDDLIGRGRRLSSARRLQRARRLEARRLAAPAVVVTDQDGNDVSSQYRACCFANGYGVAAISDTTARCPSCDASSSSPGGSGGEDNGNGGTNPPLSQVRTVTISLVVQGVTFATLESNPTLKAQITDDLETRIASTLSVTKSQVAVTLSAGSLNVQAVVTTTADQLATVQAAATTATSGGGSSPLVSTVLTGLSGPLTAAGLITGPLSSTGASFVVASFDTTTPAGTTAGGSETSTAFLGSTFQSEIARAPERSMAAVVLAALAGAAWN